MISSSLVGHLGQDADLRTTASGNPFCTFSLGVDLGFGDKASTEWVDIAIFGSKANKVLPYLKRGQRVFASGALTISRFQKKNGESASKLSLTAHDLKFLGEGKKKDQEAVQQEFESQLARVNDLPF